MPARHAATGMAVRFVRVFVMRKGASRRAVWRVWWCRRGWAIDTRGLRCSAVSFLGLRGEVVHDRLPWLRARLAAAFRRGDPAELLQHSGPGLRLADGTPLQFRTID